MFQKNTEFSYSGGNLKKGLALIDTELNSNCTILSKPALELEGKTNSSCPLIGFYKYNSEVAWVGICTKFRGKELNKHWSTKDPGKEMSLCSNKK